MRPKDEKNGGNSKPSTNFIDKRSIGVNISLSLDMLRDIDNQADREKLSRSGLVRKAIEQYLADK